MTTDYRKAIAERDPFAYYAITQMAKRAGMSIAAWADAHAKLTPEEQAIFEAYQADFDLWARHNPADWQV